MLNYFNKKEEYIKLLIFKLVSKNRFKLLNYSSLRFE